MFDLTCGRFPHFLVRSARLVEDLDKVALRIQEWHDDDEGGGAASREHASRGELETVQEELVPDVEKGKLKKRDGNGWMPVRQPVNDRYRVNVPFVPFLLLLLLILILLLLFFFFLARVFYFEIEIEARYNVRRIVRFVFTFRQNWFTLSSGLFVSFKYTLFYRVLFLRKISADVGT